MKTKVLLEMDLNTLLELFSQDEPATVTFTKKDGTTRVLTGTAVCDKDINGNGPIYNAKERNQVRLFDLNVEDKEGNKVGGWRAVTADRVIEVISGDTKYIVAQNYAKI